MQRFMYTIFYRTRKMSTVFVALSAVMQCAKNMKRSNRFGIEQAMDNICETANNSAFCCCSRPLNIYWKRNACLLVTNRLGMLITVWLRQWLDVPQKAAEQSTPQIVLLIALEVLIISPAYLPSRNEVDNAHGSRKVSLKSLLCSQLFSLSISVWA